MEEAASIIQGGLVDLVRIDLVAKVLVHLG